MVSAVLLTAGATGAQALEAYVGIHQLELEKHRGEPPTLTGDEAVPAFPAVKGRTDSLTRDVFGFYPYWVGDYSGFQWDLLSVVAYFSAEVDTGLQNGSIAALHGWGSSTGPLIATAHGVGVKVVLAVTCFDGPTITSILGSTANRARFVNNCLDLVVGAGGDGVNIDFEGVPGGSSNKANLVNLMAELSDAFHAAIPGSHVSIDTPAVDWSGVFDYDALALACDGLFIMGYNYHWSSGEPGPVAPKTDGGIWPWYTVTWSVADYLEWGGVENRDKFILGLPFYGYNWPATDFSIPGTAAGRADAITYAQARGLEATYGAGWDAYSQTPYTFYSDSGPRQAWCDNTGSLGLKFDLVVDEDLGGVGIWALNYEGGYVDVWDEIRDRFGDCVDADGDGHADEACGGDDCDDTSPTVNPDMQGLDCSSAPNGIDNDCDGETDEDECLCFIGTVI